SQHLLACIEDRSRRPLLPLVQHGVRLVDEGGCQRRDLLPMKCRLDEFAMSSPPLAFEKQQAVPQYAAEPLRSDTLLVILVMIEERVSCGGWLGDEVHRAAMKRTQSNEPSIT